MANMVTEKPIVRHARREDVVAILQLVRELADYEREIDSVEATEEKLLATIAFAPSEGSSPRATPVSNLATGPGLPNTEPPSPEKPARCLMLFTPEGAPAGMALYFYNYSTWRARPGIFVEDMFVRPSQRRKGYGRLLLAELAREVAAMNGGRLEWNVLKWNEPSIKFYEGIGAERLDEWVGMRVDGDGLVRLAASLD